MNYNAPIAEKIELSIVNILMTSADDNTESGENQLPINPRGGKTPV